MAREPEPEEPAVEAFKKANVRTVQRVIELAAKNAARQARRNRPRHGPGMVARALDAALANHDRTARHKPSIRLTAPDTGGRPYHFGYTVVIKGERRRSEGKDAAAGPTAAASRRGTVTKRRAEPNAAPARKGARGASTKEGAHQAYVERDAAVARDGESVETIDQGRDQARGRSDERAAGLDPDAVRERERQPERAEAGRDEPGLEPTRSGAGAARPAQHEPPQPEERGIDAAPPRGPAPGWDADQDADPERSGDRASPAERGRVNGAETRGRTDGGATGRDQVGDARLAMDFVEDAMGNRPGLSEGRRESAAQAYIEDGRKAPKVRGQANSFGTIGDTLEERMRFWDLVHEHESSAGGRTQSRLVLELPHEAPPRARHEIVRRFVKEFEDKGIPYWASIHEPTKDNDARNHHAHVVFTDRPMARMRHPETGEEVWDFTVAETYKKKNRVRKTHFPHRQNRDPDMRRRDWVKDSRKRFAAIVNDVMVEEGIDVRYDPRSYKDMGLDVAPMKNVNRILADKSRSREFVVMDPEWTRRMIDAEMREASIRRDGTYLRLREVERNIQEGLRHTKAPRRANGKLPRSMRLSPTHRMSRTMAERLADGVLRVERDRLATRFVDEATERTLKQVIEATGGRTDKKGRPIALGKDAPDPDDLRDLNEAAKQELSAFAAER